MPSVKGRFCGVIKSVHAVVYAGTSSLLPTWMWTLCCQCCCLLFPALLQLAEIVEHTRSIKKSVEAALSKQFSGRRVNVLGEINNALATTS